MDSRSAEGRAASCASIRAAMSALAAGIRKAIAESRWRNSRAASSIGGNTRSISCCRLPGKIATRFSPAGQGSAGVGAASVRFTDSTSGCPTKTVFSSVPRNTSTSNGKITINRSRILAIFGMRLRCHAQTCGLT